MPQGSVLGPVLFLIFINDLEVGVSSTVLKFADDTKLFRPVVSAVDREQVQSDLDTICNWADRWNMEFNVSKCKVIRYGRKITNIDPLYLMYDVPIKKDNSEKDLGVVFTDDLKTASHCKECYSKANRMLGLINRTIVYKHPSVLLNLYKSLVRPHLDYCSSVWNPHYKKDKELLERVQHRFTRLFPNLKGLVYEDRLRRLGLWSLEERRNRVDLIELFKLLKGFSATPWSTFFQLNKGSVTRGHSLKLSKSHSHCEARLQFFSQRVINRWNSLSQEDVDAPSVNAFKGRLDKRRQCQMDFFID